MKILKYAKPILFGLLASFALLPLVSAQGVAPAVSIMYNGNYVSTSNPLPVTDSGIITNCTGVQPLGCAVVLQASAYGVKGDNATDNTTPLANAITAACNVAGSGIGGVTLQLPTGRVITGPQQLGCSNVVIAGYGPGYGGGTGQYPTAISPATTLVCKSATATPLLLMMPSSTTEQTGNMITSLGFDGNTDACGIGLEVTGEQQPYFERLSFLGFGTVAFLVKGGTIGGGNKGSVIHPHFQNMQFTQVLAGDGVGFELDGTSGGGDVFGASGDNFAFVQNLNPGMEFLRHDHDYFSNIQVTTLAGPTPSPAPDAITVGCNSVSLYLQNVLVQNATHILGNSTCASGGGGNNPKGTVFTNYQSYENNATGPTVDTGSTLVMSDDHGNQFYADNGNGTAPYICFGLQVPGGSPCANGNFFIANDVSDKNLLIGVRGSTGSGTGSIYFCPAAGCGPGQSVVAQSWIDPNGCYNVLSITGFPSTSVLCNGYLAVNITTTPPPSFSPGSITNGAWSGNSGSLVGITTGGLLTPVPSPPPAGGYLFTTGFVTRAEPTVSPNTWTQFGATLSGTTGVSNGATGKWLAQIILPLSQDATTLTQNTRGCIVMSTSASIVVQDYTSFSHNSICKTTLTNSIAGTTQFGDSANGGGQGLSNTGYADVIVNSSTAWSVQFYTALDGILAQPTINGFGKVTFIQI